MSTVLRKKYKTKPELFYASIESIKKYFGVSDECAKYLYHRAFRSKRTDNNYLKWTIPLQNALVRADRCLEFNWDTLIFNEEEKELINQNIIIDSLDNNETEIFKWTELNTNNDVLKDEWSIVIGNKKRRNIVLKKEIDIILIKRPGLFI